MKNNFLTVAVVLLLLVAVSIIYLYSGPQKFDWNEISLKYNDKEPYGTTILYQYLKNLNEDSLVRMDKSISNFLKGNKDTNSTYIYINESQSYTKEELKDLSQFVQRGNTALIILPEFDKNLSNSIQGINIDDIEKQNENEEDEYYDDEDEDEDEYNEEYNDSLTNALRESFFNRKDRIRAKFIDIVFEYPIQKQPFQFYYKTKNDTITIDYFTIKDTDIPHTGLAKLMYFESSGSVMAEIKSGKGRYIIHTIPLVFTNYHLKRPSGKNHLEAVLSYIPLNKIYWDNYSFNYRLDFSNLGYTSDTPLSYILSKEPLKWAFYIFLVTSLVFILFNVKRIQRAIPILNKKTNTTLEYIRSVGLLYFNYRNNREIADKMMHQFYTDVYMKYKIQHRQQQQFIEYLSKRSAFPPEKIEAIIQYHKSIMEMLAEPGDEIIIDFYKKLQEYYLNRK